MRSHFYEYLFFCHRLPDRCLTVGGFHLPLCSRCTGILLGYVLGIVAVCLSVKVPFLISILCVLPLFIDGTGQFLKYWKSNNLLRLITGWGAGVGLIQLSFALIMVGIGIGKHLGNTLLMVAK